MNTFARRRCCDRDTATDAPGAAKSNRCNATMRSRGVNLVGMKKRTPRFYALSAIVLKTSIVILVTVVAGTAFPSCFSILRKK